MPYYTVLANSLRAYTHIHTHTHTHTQTHTYTYTYTQTHCRQRQSLETRHAPATGWHTWFKVWLYIYTRNDLKNLQF